MARHVETVAAHLVGDDATVRAHADQLQRLDVAVQTLDALADRLDTGSDAALVARLDNLRASWRQALSAGH
jgi:hypothetical protein